MTRSMLAVAELPDPVGRVLQRTELDSNLVLKKIACPLGVLAIIFGILGVRRADAYGSGRGMAITGIVCGAVGLAIAFLFLLLIYAVLSSFTVIGAAAS